MQRCLHLRFCPLCTRDRVFTYRCAVFVLFWSGRDPGRWQIVLRLAAGDAPCCLRRGVAPPRQRRLHAGGGGGMAPPLRHRQASGMVWPMGRTLRALTLKPPHFSAAGRHQRGGGVKATAAAARRRLCGGSIGILNRGEGGRRGRAGVGSEEPRQTSAPLTGGGVCVPRLGAASGKTRKTAAAF